ncbi:MAG: hypothetical protein J0H35_07245, partial [Rhodospirillales bacterium]|nr:hypothetical protein [Rhodospirillales bacterium]
MSPLDQPTATLPAGAAMRPAPAGRPGGPWLRTRRARATLWQALAVVAMIALLLWLAGNARENVAARNISFGFDFLFIMAVFD